MDIPRLAWLDFRSQQGGYGARAVRRAAIVDFALARIVRNGLGCTGGDLRGSGDLGRATERPALRRATSFCNSESCYACPSQRQVVTTFPSQLTTSLGSEESDMLAPSQTLGRSSTTVVGLLLVTAVLIALVGFGSGLSEVVVRWIRQDEYSHGFLIPLISAWLLWSRRDVLTASIGQPTWMGPALVALSIFMHIVGELSALFILSQVGFVVALVGIVLSAGGYSLLKVTLTPILFLLFAIPLPYFIESVLTWRLQLISSELGVAVIRLFQIPVYLEGNVIDLGYYKLQVVEACSGLRYLYPLLSLGFLAAYFFHAPFWQRAVVFLSAIPITILMNSLRIGLVGVLVNRWGTGAAEGLLHFFEGWTIFIASAGLLIGEMALLARLGSRKSFFEAFALPVVAAPKSSFSSNQPRISLMVSVALLCGARSPLSSCLTDKKSCPTVFAS